MPRFTSILLSYFFLSIAVTSAAPFVHPGGLHTKEDLDRMKAKVAAREHPWIDGWDALRADKKSRADWKPAPRADMPARGRAQDDATAMYYNALIWYISGEKEHGDCAVRIANAWSAVVKGSPPNDYLTAIPVGSFALAGELLRTYPGWQADDLDRFKKMLSEEWYPKCDDYLKTHGGTPEGHYWANWDTCNMLAILAIGVFCDDRAKFDQAIGYFWKGTGTGSIRNIVPFLYPDDLGQWQESGRDQAHAMGGTGQMAHFCQVAWNQGVDLFAAENNRFLAGAEYTAQYTLWKGVPYTFYNNTDEARQPWISQNYHGRLEASHYELLYNHYVVRQGIQAPHVKLFAELMRPEGGNVDIFGYGTLTFTLDAKASPYPAATVPPVPMDLTAVPGMKRVDLRWSPSGAYTARGYEVFRATSPDGPFTSIYSTQNWTTPAYTDTRAEPGTTYYYAVAALNQYGSSARSASISAIPAAAGNLPDGWRTTLAHRAASTPAANGSFSLATRKGPVGKQNFLFRGTDGDFVLTARVIAREGKIDKAGIMVRQDNNSSDLTRSPSIAFTLGETGGRQARMRVRARAGEKETTHRANDYTWLPAWFRISRVGDEFTGLQSSDGITWFETARATIPMPKTCVSGLLAEGDDGTVLYDNVTLVPKLQPVPAAPANLTVQQDSGSTTLRWETPAPVPADPPPGHTGIKIEAATATGGFYEITDLSPAATHFTHTGLPDPSALRYRLRTYNSTGYSPYSKIAPLR